MLPAAARVKLGASRLHAWVTPFGLIIYAVIYATQQTHVSAQVTWDRRVMKARSVIAPDITNLIGSAPSTMICDC